MHETVQDVIILDAKENNIIYFTVDNKVNYFTMKDNDKKKILDIINNDKLLKIKDIPEPFVLDGCVNIFYFSNLKVRTKISTSNICSYIEDEKAPSNAKMLIDTFDKISSILNGYDINIYLDIPEDSLHMEDEKDDEG